MVAGSYPNGGATFNISKETTKREIISVEGAEEKTVRMEGINLSSGFTNAVEIATNLFNLPSFDVLLSEFSNV
jgi:hypothetical protein